MIILYNRQPTPGMEGRVKITPETGNPFYAKMEMADNPLHEGTPISKQSFLQDNTAGMFGMGESAVPDDVFSWLGQYNQHWWQRRAYGEHWEVVLQGLINTASVTRSNNSSNAFNVPYSDTLTIDPLTGEFDLQNPKTVSVSHGTYSKANVLKGKYFKPIDYGTPSPIRFAPTDAPNATPVIDGVVHYVALASSEVKTVFVESHGQWEVFHSADRNAYPDSGVSDGYEWQYLGVPFDNAVNAPKIDTGSYVGTGKYGVNNPNSLTFGFNPQILIIQDGVTGIPCTYIYPFTGLKVGFYNAGVATFSISGNTVSWYNTSASAEQQLNTSGRNYNYLAIG